jgi:hypothetical protein
MKKIDLEYNENNITRPRYLNWCRGLFSGKTGDTKSINHFKKRQKKAVFVSLNHGLTG